VEKPRQIAFEVLLEHNRGQDFVEDVLAEALAKRRLQPNDRGLVHELVCGVVRWERLLDWIIQGRTEDRPQQAIVRILLRLGLYQLLILDRIPVHAAVHETVELAKSQNLGPVAGFINAFLRKAAAEIDGLKQQIVDLEGTNPDVRFSHPEWLFNRWKSRWGLDPTLQLMRWNNEPPPVFARVNRLRTTPEALEAAWTQEGVQFKPCAFPWTVAGDIYQLIHPPAFGSLKSFESGGFYVQDPSTLLAVHALDPQPGQRILDLCAAPGGKTALIAQRLQNRGSIFAQDTHLGRLRLIKQNCDRLGVTCVRVSTSTSVTHPELSIQFDRILLDAPCSNTGVMRRRVDLRWRITSTELDRLVCLQSDLLKDAAPQLGVGGVLTYSTCSLEPEENEDQIQAFLSNYPQFERVQTQAIHPVKDGIDGAYVVVLKRFK
jgi:16S rRNA (cytosine967-C5)-methyltransferase